MHSKKLTRVTRFQGGGNDGPAERISHGKELWERVHVTTYWKANANAFELQRPFAEISWPSFLLFGWGVLLCTMRGMVGGPARNTWTVWSSSKCRGDSIRIRCLPEAKKMPQWGPVFPSSLGKPKRIAISEFSFLRADYYGYVLRVHYKMDRSLGRRDRNNIQSAFLKR